jgi:hypothetical protein
MLEAVDFQPLLFGACLHESLDVAAQMQTLPADVRRESCVEK